MISFPGNYHRQHLATLFPPKRVGSAFTLVELLVVIAVISLLAVVVTPALRGTMEGIHVSGAGAAVEAEITLARQTAITRNLPVEMRIYKHDDGSGEAWRLLALVITASASGKANDEWLAGGTLLPGNVLLDDSGSFSTILSSATPIAPSGTKTAPWTQVESSTAPSLLRGKNCVGFTFRPDGSTDLPVGQPWCLSLRSAHSRPGATTPASNFVALVIDSYTGRTLFYQP